MNVTRLRLIFRLIPGLALAIGAHGAVAAEPTARDLHAASCVAALDQNTRELAQQVQVGKDDLRGLLLERLVAGTAFVGDVYLHSEVEEKQAKELANQALQAQKSLPEAELAARQTACAAEGTKLYEQSNGLEQSLVKHVARKRMNKLLGA
ncbi:MAG: hypothetical protein M3Y32_06180 [Pseudomonadota bacterium]|nr:hypothetical protein [Pseudomonadota bacterium]